jgi:hypothetical protein
MKKIFSLTILALTIVAFLPTTNVLAAPTQTVCTTASNCSPVPCPSPTGNSCISGKCDCGDATPASTSSTALTNPIGTKICAKTATGQECVQSVLGSVIKTAMGIVGSIALLMAVWGGFLWLTSMGNETKVEQGKKTLIWAILGLVLIFGAYALTTYIFSAIAPVAK